MNALLAHCSHLRLTLSTHLARFSAARVARDRGASAVELAIISALIIGIAVAVVAAIKIFVTNQDNNIINGGN